MDCPFTGEGDGVTKNLKNGFWSKTRSQSPDANSNALSLSPPETASLPGLTVILGKLKKLREGGLRSMYALASKVPT